MERPAPTQALLVPLDGSPLADHAIPYAAALAAAGARIVLFRVLPRFGEAEGVLGRLTVTETVSQAVDRAAREDLERGAAALGDRFAVELATATGEPADTILAAVEAQGIGAVVIASHGRGAVGRWMFGSVADRVARATPVPVAIVRPEDPDAPPAPVALRRLLVPLDGSDLAMEALPVAEQIAATHGWPVHLLTAIEVSALTPIAVPGPGLAMSGGLYEEVYDELRLGAQETLDAAAARLGSGARTTTEVRVGPPYAAIADALQPGDLIVLTSHGRSGLRRWLLGSVAEQLVRFAPAPVMLVPASGRTATRGTAA